MGADKLLRQGIENPRSYSPFCYGILSCVIFIPQELNVAAGAPVFSFSPPLLAKSGGRKEAKGGIVGMGKVSVCEAVCKRKKSLSSSASVWLPAEAQREPGSGKREGF